MFNQILSISWKDVMLAILESIAAALLYALVSNILARWKYRKHLYRKYHNRTCRVYYKHDLKTLKRTAICTVKGATIKFKGRQIEGQPLEGRFTGEFIMNTSNLRIGEGIFYHDQKSMFNFPKIFIKDDKTFYTETTYVMKDKGMQNENAHEKNASTYRQIRKHQAYVWKIQEPQKKTLRRNLRAISLRIKRIFK